MVKICLDSDNVDRTSICNIETFIRDISIMNLLIIYNLISSELDERINIIYESKK